MTSAIESPSPTEPPAGEAVGVNKWRTLISVSLGIMMVALDGTVVSVANPTIGRDLHASLADLQWVTNGYLLAVAVLLVFGGRLPPGALDRRADPVPGRAGHVRRDDAAGDARVPARRVPRRRARARGRDLGRNLGDRDRIGSVRRRPARPARVVGVDLPAEPPAGRDRARGRVLLDHRD